MQDVLYIEDVEQASTLLQPLRIELLKQMGEPRTCPSLADAFGESPQKIYYHVKALQKAGLVDKIEERRVRGVVEGYYQAKARSYWMSPHLVNSIGGSRPTRDQISLRVLLTLAEEMQDEIGHLANQSEAGKDVASLSLSANINLNAARRAEFLEELQTVFQNLARKYGIIEDELETDEQGFRLVLACYPKLDDKGK